MLARLSDNDLREIQFLSELLIRLEPLPSYEPQRDKILTAILEGEAERAGVDTCRLISDGKIGVLERERLSHNSHYWPRVFNYMGRTFDIDKMFGLEANENYAFKKLNK